MSLEEYARKYAELKQKLQQLLTSFKVKSTGTNETNASCCCHFEKNADFECPLKKRLEEVFERREGAKMSSFEERIKAEAFTLGAKDDFEVVEVDVVLKAYQEEKVKK